MKKSSKIILGALALFKIGDCQIHASESHGEALNRSLKAAVETIAPYYETLYANNGLSEAKAQELQQQRLTYLSDLGKIRKIDQYGRSLESLDGHEGEIDYKAFFETQQLLAQLEAEERAAAASDSALKPFREKAALDADFYRKSDFVSKMLKAGGKKISYKDLHANDTVQFNGHSYLLNNIDIEKAKAADPRNSFWQSVEATTPLIKYMFLEDNHQKITVDFSKLGHDDFSKGVIIREITTIFGDDLDAVQQGIKQWIKIFWEKKAKNLIDQRWIEDKVLKKQKKLSKVKGDDHAFKNKLSEKVERVISERDIINLEKSFFDSTDIFFDYILRSIRKNA